MNMGIIAASRLRADVDTTSFITVWDTTKSGETNNDQVKLPINESSGVINCIIYWGDGTQTSINSASSPVHTYTTAGIYTITISGTLFNAWGFKNSGDKRKITKVLQFGDNNMADSNTDGGFMYGCSNLDLSEVTDIPNITGSLVAAFRDCTSLTTVNLINNWVIPVMGGSYGIGRFFENCPNLIADIPDWDFNTIQSLSKFMTNSVIPTASYDSLLINTSNRTNLVSGITATFGNSKYTSGGTAETARNVLINTYNWNIQDGGQV